MRSSPFFFFLVFSDMGASLPRAALAPAGARPLPWCGSNRPELEVLQVPEDLMLASTVWGEALTERDFGGTVAAAWSAAASAAAPFASAVGSNRLQVPPVLAEALLGLDDRLGSR